MTGAPLVVLDACILDACILANFSLCDTLLRLAEPPRLYEVNWSEEIISGDNPYVGVEARLAERSDRSSSRRVARPLQ